MSIAVSGSLAYDTLLSFPGAFEDQILPDRLNSLSVSFLVPLMRREYGGCAGNIAYNLFLLGERPLVVAALGVDGSAYRDRLVSWGLELEWVTQHRSLHTAQATIMTDKSNNQITAFHPGAMGFAHESQAPDGKHAKLAIVSPNGKQAMIDHAAHFAVHQIPFIWDPGQGLPMFSGAELHQIIPTANWVTVNDYEAELLSQRMETDFASISEMVEGLIITRGEAGCDLWISGQMQTVSPYVPVRVIDPTGCGDSFRAGLLYGLSRGWALDRACKLGNRIGAAKVAHKGGQNHTLDLPSLLTGL